MQRPNKRETYSQINQFIKLGEMRVQSCCGTLQILLYNKNKYPFVPQEN